MLVQKGEQSKSVIGGRGCTAPPWQNILFMFQNQFFKYIFLEKISPFLNLAPAPFWTMALHASDIQQTSAKKIVFICWR